MQTQANPIVQLVPFIFIFAVMYFLIIRPQRQEQKRHQEMITKLAKNDDIITAAGIHGTIVNVKDKTFVVRVDDNCKIEIEKNAVSTVISKQSESKGN